jgi:hypothetical protein
MCQQLTKLAEDFARYRGKKKRAKYPLTLWEKAIQLCKLHSLEAVANSLQVHSDSLRRYLKKPLQNRPKKLTTQPTQSAQFIPIAVTNHSSVQIHFNGALAVTVDFDRSTEELAKLLLTLQGGLSC